MQAAIRRTLPAGECLSEKKKKGKEKKRTRSTLRLKKNAGGEKNKKKKNGGETVLSFEFRIKRERGYGLHP